MAQNGRVNPNCSYASNPYHECTDNCLRKIKEITPQKSKKGSGAIPLKFNWKKKPDPKPESPVLDSVLASKVGAYHSERKRVEPKSNEHISSEPVSMEKHVQDVKPVYHNHKELVKDDVEHFANNSTEINQEDEKYASDKVDESNYVDHDTGEEGLTTSAGKLLNFSFSGISITNDNEDSDIETASLASEPRVPIGGYNVRESFAPILRSIFEKYGDIGASCHLESIVMRSYYIECVCFVVQELQSTSIMQFTKSKVKELLAILKDVESARLQVAWLRKIVDEVAEYVELMIQHRDVEIAKANSDSEVESLREELRSEMETLAQKEEELAAIRTRIDETKERLREVENKSFELEEGMSLILSKVESLDSKSLIDELL
ncbi:plant phospholipase-like protein [Senna tora]|uniref:Plant phospholipase-like protein n=1 Tax=Senna tora TaxID=362788 RepID=A0A834XAD0_9FABA|nr:plant phospholipase-like protein [Senna tora]